ncbi:MAG: glutathione peroxidase [Lachnospiraceae bacterium]|jgi:glutathione peroxidase|nr:glutathione peroxidase [Lachnospiraceae bacterium]
MNIYDFVVKSNKNEDVSLSEYEGKVLLVVNTATKCGLTPQYDALEALYKKYHDRGLEILDFPCNQFKEQAPESDEEISSFCALKYGTTFPRFKKIDVNGEQQSPLYKWLKEQAPKDKGNLKTKAFEVTVKPFRTSKDPSDIVWNFGKFLIDREGNVAERFSPALSPNDLSADIERLL